MSRIINFGLSLYTGLMYLLLWIFGSVRFVLWLLITQWYIPSDKLAQTLELDLAILEILPGKLRGWYSKRQYARRWQSERRLIIQEIA